MFWLTPRFWVALVAALVLAAAGAFLYSAGGNRVQVKWNAERAALAVLAKETEHENRNIETARLRNVVQAQEAAAKRSAAIELSARDVARTADRLSADLATQRLQLPGFTRSAVDAYAKTANIVFEQCVAKYRAVAADADAAFSHIETLESSWPTK